MSATRLRQRRKELGFTQVSLADAVGVEGMTVSRWERGESLPRRRFWPKLAEELKIPLSEVPNITTVFEAVQ